MAGESQETPGSRPDPSVFTTEAIARARESERDYFDGQLGIIRARLDGMDEATKVLHETVTRIPTDTQLAVGHLKELHAERFGGVQKQFDERDTRQERESRDNKVAVDAAFAAQKESAAAQDAANQKAIDKSEKTTLDTIRQVLGQVDDLKERVGKIENIKLGQGEQRTTTNQNLTALYGLGGFVLAVLLIGGIVAAVVGFK